MVKKCGLLKIMHDQFKKTGKGENTVLADYLGSFEAASESNKDLEPLLGKNQVSWCIAIVYLFGVLFTVDSDNVCSIGSN